MNNEIDSNSACELDAIQAGLDSIGASLRGTPDSGFEARVAANAAREAIGEPTLRIAGFRSRAPESRSPALMLRVAASVLIGAGALGVAWFTLRGPDAARLDESLADASAAELEIAEIADAWDLLDDTELATRFEDVSSRVTTVADSVGDSWLPSSWIEEDSM
jgi:hypothetical protein